MPEAPREGRSAAIAAALIQQGGSVPAGELGFRRLRAQTGPQGGFQRIGTETASTGDLVRDTVRPEVQAPRGSSARETQGIPRQAADTRSDAGMEQVGGLAQARSGIETFPSHMQLEDNSARRKIDQLFAQIGEESQARRYSQANTMANTVEKFDDIEIVRSSRDHGGDTFKDVNILFLALCMGKAGHVRREAL